MDENWFTINEFEEFSENLPAMSKKMLLDEDCADEKEDESDDIEIITYVDHSRKENDVENLKRDSECELAKGIIQRIIYTYLCTHFFF